MNIRTIQTNNQTIDLQLLGLPWTERPTIWGYNPNHDIAQQTYHRHGAQEGSHDGEHKKKKCICGAENILPQETSVVEDLRHRKSIMTKMIKK